MADGHFPTLVSATRDANTATNPLFAALTDGTTAVTLTGSSLNVNITGGSTGTTQYAEDTAHASGDLGVEMLAVRRDTLATSVSADGDYSSLSVNASGALYVAVAGSVTVTATDLDIRDLSHTQDSVRIGDGTDLANVTAAGELNVLATAQPGVDIGDVTINNGAGAAAVNIQDGGNSITVDGTVAVSSVAGNVTVVQPTGSNLHVVVDSGAITVSATDLDIRDLTLAQDAVKVSANSTANSATNPIFVKEVDAVVSNEVHSYNTASAVASDATSNHDYTVTGTTFLLKSVKFACSGGGKVEIQTGPVASLATVCVGFIPKEGGICQIDFNPPKEVPVTSTGTVRLIRTNRQGQAQDLYSTIIGNDIP